MGRISWQDVLDSTKKWHGDIDTFASLAVKTGYMYFTWNGLVYVVNRNGFWELTSWTVDDIS
jgi:hypothetical protein